MALTKVTDVVADLTTIDEVANADTLDYQHASEFSLVAHDHDDRYYTESEVDGLIAPYIPTPATCSAINGYLRMTGTLGRAYVDYSEHAVHYDYDDAQT